MHFYYTPYILPLVASSIVAGLVSVYVWQRRTTASGAVPLVLLGLASAVWSLGYALEIAGGDLPTKIVWGKIQYLGIVTIPLLWVIFTYSYASKGILLTRRLLILLSIVPLVTLLLAFTNESHGLIWEKTQLYRVGAFSALEITHGFWFWIYWGYSNLLLLGGTILILWSFNWMKGLFLRQNMVLLIAVLTPWLGNVLYILKLSPIPHLDFTPFAFTISVVVFTLGIFRLKLVNLAPVARDLVVEKMREGMIVLDTQANVVDINSAFQKMLGVSAPQAIGQQAKDLFRAWPALVERYGKMIEGRDEVIFGQGETQSWYELHISPLFDSHDRLLGRVVTLRDISERKRMEEALRLSEERYRKIYENVADVIYETDNHGHLTAISPSIEKQAGYAPEELIGRNVTDFFIFPEHYAALDAAMIRNGSVNDFEAVLRQKDGTEKFVSITAHILLDANGEGVATEGVLRDIGERKQAEERIKHMNADLERRVGERTSELQESNTYLTTLIETSIALHERLDLDAVLDRILVQAHKLVPARSLNVLFVEGEQVWVVRHLGRKGLEKMEQNVLSFRFPLSWRTFQRMRATGRSVHIADTASEPEWRDIQGSEWARSYLAVPLVIHDETIGFLEAIHGEPDFFEEKHRILLESLAHHASVAVYNARLLAELKEALEKEQGMRNQLVQADKLVALGKMVSVIAHEINNPIQTVKNTFYLLEDQIIPGSPAVDYLKMGSAEANRIADLVAQLRGIYASGSKAVVPVDLSALLGEVRDLLTPQLKTNHVEWCQADGSRPWVVCGVRNNLKQVFINLCQNAIEAMEGDEEGRISVRLLTGEDGQRVGVEFHNTGPLINEETLPLLFDPFFTTKRNGTGLGLPISYDIIRQHQGELLVESAPEKGVAFTVWLPLAPEAEKGGPS